MKIIYYSKPYFADCDFPLIKELRRQGHQIIFLLVITKESLKSTLINIPQIYPHNGIFETKIYPEISRYNEYIDSQDTFIINYGKKTNYFGKLKFALKIRNFIASHKADYLWTTLPFELNECLLYTIKNIAITIHDPFPHTGEYYKRNIFFKRLALKLCNKVFLLNETLKHSFSKAYNVPLTSIYTNKLGPYNCINLFTHKKTLSPAHPYILFYGRISPYKGIEYLIKAFLKLHELHPELHLIIAGNGNFYFDISTYTKLKFIEIKNYYIDMEETANLFQHAEYIVCPYTDATQSGVIMTAYTLGKSVIATNVGALGEIVIDNFTGLITKPQNIEDLYDKMNLLYTNKELKEHIEKNIQKIYTIGENSWQYIARKYISFFKS